MVGVQIYTHCVVVRGGQNSVCTPEEVFVYSTLLWHTLVYHQEVVRSDADGLKPSKFGREGGVKAFLHGEGKEKFVCGGHGMGTLPVGKADPLIYCKVGITIV